MQETQGQSKPEQGKSLLFSESSSLGQQESTDPMWARAEAVLAKPLSEISSMISTIMRVKEKNITDTINYRACLSIANCTSQMIRVSSWDGQTSYVQRHSL